MTIWGSKFQITSPNQVLKSVEQIGVNLGSKLSVGDKFVIETEKIGKRSLKSTKRIRFLPGMQLL